MAKPNVIFLHGWGTTWESLYPLVQLLKSHAHVFTPNLLTIKNKILTLDDYVADILQFIKKNKIKNPVIIGHSLGGAIATKIAAQHPGIATKIVLLSAASIRHDIPQPWRTINTLISPLKPLLTPLRQIALKLAHLDASDYLELKTPIEKQTFQNLIRNDQSTTLSAINIPTLILWGDNDTATLIADGLKIHSLIKNSIFYSFPKAGHFFYLDHPDKCAQMIIKFIKHDS